MAKKRLTQSEEFQIMKLVLDKFLWVGTIVMLYGLYQILTGSAIQDGILFIIGGAFVLVIFMFIIVKEYEIIK